MTVRKFHDLPGIADLEVRLERIEAHPNPEWSPDADGLAGDVDVLSRRLFGIGEDETTYREPEDGPEMDDEAYYAAVLRWEQHFALLQAEDDEEERQSVEIFRAMGWDVTDAEAAGAPLLAIDHLGRQLVCAVKGLCGARLPGAPMDDDQAREAAGSWGAALEAEAAKFKGKRR